MYFGNQFNDTKQGKQTSSLIDFEKFYSKLFSHDDVEENESHKIVHDEVNNYYENIKEKKFELDISNEFIESCFKKLKNNKAVGNDFICNEMLKNAKCLKLTYALKQIFGDIINEGIILHKSMYQLSLQLKQGGKKLRFTTDLDESISGLNN